jgi:Domain of unknown function (DUF4177)
VIFSVAVTYRLSSMNPLEQEPRRYEYLIIFDSCSSDPDVDEATRMSLLNHYGEEGWELVSVCAPVKTYKGESSCYYFKRAVVAR